MHGVKRLSGADAVAKKRAEDAPRIAKYRAASEALVQVLSLDPELYRADHLKVVVSVC